MTKVRKLVDRWLAERVEIDGEVNVLGGKGNDAFQAVMPSITKPDSESVIKANDGFGNFIEWIKEQKDGGFVEPYQWSSAMKQSGFERKKDGNDWVIRGIKLKKEVDLTQPSVKTG